MSNLSVDHAAKRSCLDAGGAIFYWNSATVDRRGTKKKIENPDMPKSRIASSRTPTPASIVVTTYGPDTRYTQLCLERIAAWKARHHEVVVVAHDVTPTLRFYLDYMVLNGVVDKLLLTESGHGHLRGVNLGFRHARHDILFNINNDVRVGPGVVDECAARLRLSKRAGLIGWHYDWSGLHAGTRWHGSSLSYTIRTREAEVRNKGVLDDEHVCNIKQAPWYSGKVFDAIGDKRILCANTSFFGTWKPLWLEIGGFDVERYPHYWADDFLCYAILDKGFDILNLPEYIRRSNEFECLSDYKYEGIPEPERLLDAIVVPSSVEAGDQVLGFLRRSSGLGAKAVPSIPEPSSRAGSLRGLETLDQRTGLVLDPYDHVLVHGKRAAPGLEPLPADGVSVPARDPGTASSPGYSACVPCHPRAGSEG